MYLVLMVSTAVRKRARIADAMSVCLVSRLEAGVIGIARRTSSRVALNS